MPDTGFTPVRRTAWIVAGGTGVAVILSLAIILPLSLDDRQPSPGRSDPATPDAEKKPLPPWLSQADLAAGTPIAIDCGEGDAASLRGTTIENLDAMPPLSDGGRAVAAGWFEPEGARFPQGARVTWPLREGLFPGAKLWIVAWDEQTGQWRGTGQQANVEASGRAASGVLFHCSVAGLSMFRPENMETAAPVESPQAEPPGRESDPCGGYDRQQLHQVQQRLAREMRQFASDRGALGLTVAGSDKQAMKGNGLVEFDIQFHTPQATLVSLHVILHHPDRARPNELTDWADAMRADQEQAAEVSWTAPPGTQGAMFTHQPRRKDMFKDWSTVSAEGRWRRGDWIVTLMVARTTGTWVTNKNTGFIEEQFPRGQERVTGLSEEQVTAFAESCASAAKKLAGPVERMVDGLAEMLGEELDLAASVRRTLKSGQQVAGAGAEGLAANVQKILDASLTQRGCRVIADTLLAHRDSGQLPDFYERLFVKGRTDASSLMFGPFPWSRDKLRARMEARLAQDDLFIRYLRRRDRLEDYNQKRQAKITAEFRDCFVDLSLAAIGAIHPPTLGVWATAASAVKSLIADIENNDTEAIRGLPNTKKFILQQWAGLGKYPLAYAAYRTCEAMLKDYHPQGVPMLPPLLEQAVAAGGANEKTIMARLDYTREVFGREMWLLARMLELLKESKESFLTKTLPQKKLFGAIQQARAEAAVAEDLLGRMREASIVYYATSYWGGWSVDGLAAKRKKPD